MVLILYIGCTGRRLTLHADRNAGRDDPISAYLQRAGPLVPERRWMLHSRTDTRDCCDSTVLRSQGPARPSVAHFRGMVLGIFWKFIPGAVC